MKKIFNTVWELFGWLICIIVFGYLGYSGFIDYVIGIYNTPVASKGLFFFIFKYPGLMFFFFLSLGLSIVSVSAFIGFFLRLFGKNT